MPSSKSNPHPELAAPILDKSLEMQIALAEKAVIARDARLREHMDEISDRVRTGPRRFLRQRLGVLAAVAGVGVALGGFAWWRSRRSPAPPAREADTPPPRKERWSVLAFLPTLWRLLPAAVKAPVTHAVSDEVHHVAALLARFARRKTTQPVDGSEAVRP